MGALGLAASQNLMLPQLQQEDKQFLQAFKHAEEQKHTGDLPDAKTPYLFLSKPSSLTIQNDYFERVRQRMFFSTIDEADNSVSEANKIKRIIYKESMTFKEWNNALEQRKLNCKKNRKILS